MYVGFCYLQPKTDSSAYQMMHLLEQKGMVVFAQFQQFWPSFVSNKVTVVEFHAVHPGFESREWGGGMPLILTDQPGGQIMQTTVWSQI